MKRADLNQKAEESLRALFSDDPPEDDTPKLRLDWEPNLSPTQYRLYKCKSRYMLAYGERGTGKTVAVLHKLVRHLVMNRNANATVMIKESGQAVDGGMWAKLKLMILPQWVKGMGIQHSVEKYDPNTKKPYFWVSNKFGGWSKVSLLSLYVEDHVGDKVKGREFSFLAFDEAQTSDSFDYFEKVTQQVGRYHGIDGDEQQTVYSCNPAGESHWLFQVFLTRPIDEASGHPFDEEKGGLDKHFAVFHVPIHENIHNLPEGYWERVKEACKRNPIEHARMIEGRWVDMPEGDALFAEAWKEEAHLRGDYHKSQGIIPIAGHSIICSYDLGSAHSSVHFEQMTFTKDKRFLVVFDEINTVGQYVRYDVLVARIIERLRYWEKVTGTQFRFEHISDDSAFNQFRAATGSFDHKDVEDASRAYVAKLELDERFIIKMKPCPKPAHSVEARVRLVMDYLLTNQIVVSAMCPKAKQMFQELREDKKERYRPLRSKHLHSFDSMTYAPFYYSTGHAMSLGQVERVKPAPLYRIAA